MKPADGPGFRKGRGRDRTSAATRAAAELKRNGTRRASSTCTRRHENQAPRRANRARYGIDGDGFQRWQGIAASRRLGGSLRGGGGSDSTVLGRGRRLVEAYDSEVGPPHSGPSARELKRPELVKKSVARGSTAARPTDSTGRVSYAGRPDRAAAAAPVDVDVDSADPRTVRTIARSERLMPLAPLIAKASLGGAASSFEGGRTMDSGRAAETGSISGGKTGGGGTRGSGGADGTLELRRVGGISPASATVSRREGRSDSSLRR